MAGILSDSLGDVNWRRQGGREAREQGSREARSRGSKEGEDRKI